MQKIKPRGVIHDRLTRARTVIVFYKSGYRARASVERD